MSQTITASVVSSINALYQSSAPFSTTLGGTVARAFNKSYATSAITKLYFQNYASGSPTSIDLTSLTDAYGVAISFTTVKHLLICNNDGTNAVTVGGGTNGLFSALPSLIGGGAYNLTTNFTVDGTHKIILITPAAGTPSVDVVVMGV